MPSGSVGQPFGVAADPQQAVHPIVVGGHVGVGDGPVLAEAVAALGLEVVVRQAQGQPPPQVGLAAQHAGPHPGVARAGVGVVLLVDEQVLAVVGAAAVLQVGEHLLEGGPLGVGRLAHGVFVHGQRAVAGWHLAPAGMLPGPLHRAQLLLDVEALARLQQQHVQALVGERVGRHAARRARAHDDHVVGLGEIRFLGASVRHGDSVRVERLSPLTSTAGQAAAQVLGAEGGAHRALFTGQQRQVVVLPEHRQDLLALGPLGGLEAHEEGQRACWGSPG